MSIGDPHAFHFTPEGLPDAADLAKSVDLMLKDWRIVTGVDVPYCMGYSEDGTTIYVDRDVPEFYIEPGQQPLAVWRGSGFVHESFEKTILEKYGNEHYQGAHTFATYWENAYVRSRGLDPDKYEAWWKPIIAKIGARKSYPRVPADLDLTPYHDSGDAKLIERMNFVEVKS